jgi:hypothetical protein
MQDAEIRTLKLVAAASSEAKDHTQRTLALALLQAADQIDAWKVRAREATALVGKLSYELSTTTKENQRLARALHDLSFPARRTAK